MHLDYPTIFYRTIFPTDLFGLYVLFSLADHVMVPQRTVSFKCRLMHMHPRAYVCIINEKTKDKFPRENHVAWIGKQNIPAKNVYFSWLLQVLLTHLQVQLRLQPWLAGLRYDFFFTGGISLLFFVILISSKYLALPISELLPPRISVAKRFKVYIHN